MYCKNDIKDEPNVISLLKPYKLIFIGTFKRERYSDMCALCKRFQTKLNGKKIVNKDVLSVN